MNKVLLIGRVGKDPELRTTGSGTSVVSASLATTESFKGKDGQKQEKTDWHNLQIWGKSAEIFSKYVKKGDRVCVEGRVTYRQWNDRDGAKRTQTDIVVEKFEFLQDKRNDDSGRRGDNGNGSRNSPPPPSAAPPQNDEFDDCPF